MTSSREVPPMPSPRTRRTGAERPVRIGVTGPIGCGKSQVARWLAELGAAVVDADVVAREVTAPGTPVHDAILRRFGAAVTAPDGTVDRSTLGRLVFSDPKALADLETLVHPAVRVRILAAIEAAEAATGAPGAERIPAIVIEAIKLVEGGLADLCDEVWLVTCNEDAQRARLAARGMPAGDAAQRIRAQTGLTERLAPMSTWVMDTTEAPTMTRTRVIARLGDMRAGRP